MKLKDLAWIFTLSLVGFCYVLLDLTSKVLFQYGGLLAFAFITLGILAYKYIIWLL